MNLHILMGRIGKEIDLRQTNSGTAVANFSVATSRYSKEKGELTDWHRIVAWGKNAENISNHFKSGDGILVHGESVTRQWEKDGIKHQSTETHVSRFEFLPNRKSDNVSKSEHVSNSQSFDDVPF